MSIILLLKEKNKARIARMRMRRMLSQNPIGSYRALQALMTFDPDFGDLNEFCINFKKCRDEPDDRTLDIGCGKQPRNPFMAKNLFGVDILGSVDPNIKSADLTTENIPFEDSTFDYITAFDFIEHIPRVVYYDGHRFRSFT